MAGESLHKVSERVGGLQRSSHEAVKVKPVLMGTLRSWRCQSHETSPKDSHIQGVVCGFLWKWRKREGWRIF